VPIVRLGNKAALDRGLPIEGNQVTEIGIFDDDPLTSRMRTIVHQDGLWPRHSDAPAAWVECDDPDLESALSSHFGCPVGMPDGWAS
jgi:hypothetical protein